jgi:hypothetical protein
MYASVKPLTGFAGAFYFAHYRSLSLAWRTNGAQIFEKMK